MNTSTCERCGTQTQGRANRRYCGDNCRKRAHEEGSLDTSSSGDRTDELAELIGTLGPDDRARLSAEIAPVALEEATMNPALLRQHYKALDLVPLLKLRGLPQLAPADYWREVIKHGTTNEEREIGWRVIIERHGEPSVSKIECWLAHSEERQTVLSLDD